MKTFDLSRNFWNWAFDNPDKISPNHAAIYFFAVEHCNRLGDKEKFGFPTMMVCDAIGIKKASTYIKYFNDLVDWGFFHLIEKSSNQYSANIISLTSALPKKGEALDKAILNHRDKQTDSMGKSKRPVDKQLDNLTTKQLNNYTEDTLVWPSFEDFWNLYDKKTDSRKTCIPKWNKLTQKKKELIMAHVPLYVSSTPDKKFRKNPSTYLNQEGWTHEIINSTQNGKGFTAHAGEYLAKNDPDWKNY